LVRLNTKKRLIGLITNPFKIIKKAVKNRLKLILSTFTKIQITEALDFFSVFYDF